MIENVSVSYIGEYLHLTPFDGYLLHNTKTDTYHSEATVKSVRNWEAVALDNVEQQPQSDDDLIGDAEALNIILGL